MLSTIRVVLIGTSHPGNIGAAARAMKTMGLSRLYLVAPLSFPDDKATEMASHAADILENAVVVDTFEEAVSDCGLVVGTSARSRAIPWPMLSPRSFAEKAKQEATHTQIAVVFGREQSGLTNDELHRCHFHIQIPSNTEYGSLNLAAAVQVITYELRVASLVDMIPEKSWDYSSATAAEMERFYGQLHQVLVGLEFLKLEAPRQLMPRLRRLFQRARLDTMEVNILRGILGAVEKLLLPKKGNS